MKKAVVYIFLLLLAAASFAAELPGRSLYIEGTAEQEDHKAFFMTGFRAEAELMDFSVTDYREEARYTFSFNVQSHADEQYPYINYMISVYLFDNEIGVELVSFRWPFAELEDMYEHIPIVFHTAAALIPEVIEEEVAAMVPERDTRWQHQLLSVRVSFDYPIVFYQLQSTGLFQGRVYRSPYPGSPPRDGQHVDHIIMPHPGLTIGVEWMFHRFASVELNFQGHIGDPAGYRFFNAAAGLQVKGILRTRYFMIQPYGAVSTPINISPEFSEFPRLAVGGGVQIGIRGFRSAETIFFDANFMLSLGDVFRYNRYAPLTYSNPPRIHYRRFVFGLGIGYRIGFIDRPDR